MTHYRQVTRSDEVGGSLHKAAAGPGQRAHHWVIGPNMHTVNDSLRRRSSEPAICCNTDGLKRSAPSSRKGESMG